MINCDNLAGVILGKIVERGSDVKTIELSVEDALKVYDALLGMDRIQKIAMSDHCGAELFT